jgi:hypothetical protein
MLMVLKRHCVLQILLAGLEGMIGIILPETDEKQAVTAVHRFLD